ncbi:MAG: HYR domain-containing protein, partial [Flavobacteriales bacterium]|nr:HYR domain-containing protein [Flavobacteriales bacterium]
MVHFYRTLGSLPAIALIIVSLCLPAYLSAQVSIICPGNITQGNDLGECSAVVNFTTPVGTGSGTNVTTTQVNGLPSGSDFPVGVTQMTFTVSNDEGDTNSCTFFVIVEDQEDPVFDCPDDITVDAAENECSAIVTFDLPDATDNCGEPSVFQFGGLPSGSAFPAGENSVDFQALDAEGNSAFCRVVINVIDISAPVIDCPDDIVVEVTDDCDAVVNYTAPVGTDICGDATTAQTGGLGSGSTFPIGTTTEEYTVTDEEGNTASCSFTVTVTDVAPPEITCPADIEIAAAPGDCDAVVSFADPAVTDNCPGETLTQTAGPASDEIFPTGETTVTFTATDAAGNTAECSFTVTVTEDEDPEITCPGDITVDNDPAECSAVVNYTAPEGTDNCPGANTELTAGIGSGGIFPVGTTVETYTVTDASGNTAECSFEVTVNDIEAPVFDCPEDITAETAPGLCEVVVSFVDPDATDNCSAVTVTQTEGPVSGSAFPVGSTEITFTAEDEDGNTSACTFNVVVTDEEAPDIDCPED